MKNKEQKERLPRTPENMFIDNTRGKSFQIRKVVEGKQKYFGSYNTIEEARRKRDELIANNWDTSVVEIRYKHRIHNIQDRYIHVQSNGESFVVQYRGGYYGQYDTIEEARAMRDRFVECGWDTGVVSVPRRRRSRDSPDRYITREGRGYSIQKWLCVGGRKELVRFDTGIQSLEEARLLRDWWVEHDWDWSEIDGM